MYVTVITPPTPVVSYTEAKAHLRLDSDDEQTLVEALVAAATGMLDGPEGKLGRSIGQQTLEARFDTFDDYDDGISLPYGPIVSPITSLKYLDADGDEQTFDAANYELLSNGTVVLTSGSSWPTLFTNDEAVRLRYVAGSAAPPAALKAAILLMTGFLYQNREATTEEALNSGAVRSLITPYAVWTI